MITYTIKVDEHGTKRWYNEKGLRHREDGPATEWYNGSKEWWLNGSLHRDDGPAIEDFNGHKEWWRHGERHRENGPAIEFVNGRKRWFLNNKQYIEKEFNDIINPSQVVEMTMTEINSLVGHTVKIVEKH